MFCRVNKTERIITVLVINDLLRLRNGMTLQMSTKVTPSQSRSPQADTIAASVVSTPAIPSNGFDTTQSTTGNQKARCAQGILSQVMLNVHRTEKITRIVKVVANLKVTDVFALFMQPTRCMQYRNHHYLTIYVPRGNSYCIFC